MVYDCGSCIVKYILCCFNFLIFLLGSVVLAVGIWLAVDKNSFIGLSKIVPNENIQHFTQPAVVEQSAFILIIIGALMFFMSFMGYCGALRESQCLLTTYGICLILILVLEITVGALSIAFKTKAEEQTKIILRSTIEKYYSTPDNPDAVTIMWDQLQMKLKCCGVNNYTDYKLSKFSLTDRKIPESCCYLNSDLKPLSSSCTTEPSESNSYYMKGCYDAVLLWIMSHVEIVIGIGIGLAFIELLCIFFSFCLVKYLNGYIK